MGNSEGAENAAPLDNSGGAKGTSANKPGPLNLMMLGAGGKLCWSGGPGPVNNAVGPVIPQVGQDALAV